MTRTRRYRSTTGTSAAASNTRGHAISDPKDNHGRRSSRSSGGGYSNDIPSSSRLSARELQHYEKLQHRLNKHVPAETFDYRWGTTSIATELEKGPRSSLIGLSRDISRIQDWSAMSSSSNETDISDESSVRRLYEAVRGLDFRQPTDVDACDSAVKDFQRSMARSYDIFQSGVKHGKAMQAKAAKKRKNRRKSRRGKSASRGGSMTRSGTRYTRYTNDTTDNGLSAAI